MVQQKITAFRDFASQLAAQVVEQLCQEFEREVSTLYNDVTLYRNELTRCAELLGHQLGREKQLHQLLANLAEHHQNVAGQINVLAGQSPSNAQLHDMVDAMTGHHSDILNSTLSGVNQAHGVASSHAESAKQLQQQTITAEHEFNRIVQMLQQPAITERAPDPTYASIPVGGSRLSPPPVAPRPAVQIGNRTPPFSAPMPAPKPMPPPLYAAAPMGPPMGPPMVAQSVAFTATPRQMAAPMSPGVGVPVIYGP